MLSFVYGILLLLASGISFLGGLILPLGIIFVAMGCLIGLIISILFIKKSMENKKVNLLSFGVIVTLMFTLLGFYFDIHRTNKIKEELYKLKAYVIKYVEENGELPNFENDEYISKYKNKPSLSYYGDGKFDIRYMDGIISSESNDIGFRPRP